MPEMKRFSDKEIKTDNNYCSIAYQCCNCDVRTTEQERNECRTTRLRLLTGEEQDLAIKKMRDSISNGVKLSAKTIRFLSYDALCSAQDDKTHAADLKAHQGSTKELLKEFYEDISSPL